MEKPFIIDPCNTAFERLTANGVVTQHPAILCCVILTVVTTGDYVDVYSGRDATSGKKVHRLKALQGRSSTFSLTHGLFCGNGIYLQFEKTDSECTVFYCPVGEL